MEWVALAIVAGILAYLIKKASGKPRRVRRDVVQKRLAMRVGCKDGVYAVEGDNSDIIKGYEFCATMQIRTPLRILEQHGTIHPGPPSQIPKCSQADGVWVPKTRTWKELGINLREPPMGTMASDVGPIPGDGGEYLKFLKAFRKIIESDLNIKQQIEGVLALPQLNSH